MVWIELELIYTTLWKRRETWKKQLSLLTSLKRSQQVGISHQGLTSPLPMNFLNRFLCSKIKRTRCCSCVPPTISVIWIPRCFVRDGLIASYRLVVWTKREGERFWNITCPSSIRKTLI